MLEGKELEGNIGSVGNYSVDIDDNGMLEVQVGAKVDLFQGLIKLAKKTKLTLDDEAVRVLMRIFGRTAEEIQAAFDAA